MTKISQDLKEKLIHSALNARKNAYAPYSNFHVGAALLLEDGSVEVGCNVENASYGLAICAERVAATTAICLGKKKFVAIAVVAPGKSPAAPCGACRQFLAEFNGSMPVILSTPEGIQKETTLSSLLPDQFQKEALIA